MKRLTLAGLLALAMTACGTPGSVSFGGYTPPEAGVPAPTTPEVKVASADITISAPKGTTPVVTLRAGKNNEHTVSGLGTHHVADLMPGVYTLSGSSINADGFTLTPQFGSNPLRIGSGGTSTTTVRYLPIGGQLAVNVQALSGLAPSVHVTGPNSFTRTVTHTGTTTFGDLLPGVYTLTADRRLAGGRYYTGVIQAETAQVQAGVTRALGVTYGAETGTLRVRIEGLPASTRAQVHLTGPGVDLTLQDSTELAGLAPGDYTLTAELVDGEDRTYTPDQASRALTIADTQVLDTSVTYTR